MTFRPRTRYQGAVVRDGAVLLIRHRDHATGAAYWLLPGGGMEPGETPEATVARELREETGLTVRVERLLLDVPAAPGGYYARAHTYLCTPLAGEAVPGFEPEPDAAATYAIDAVRWVPLGDEAAWGGEILGDPITATNLRHVRVTLSEL
jgi:8-oxo-dGTP diphosphatase